MKREDLQRLKARRHNLKLELSYDGSSYHGFQRQNKVVAIQNIVEEALCKLCKEDIQITAAGRTDAGVHARGQVINFFTDTTIPLNRFCYALNRLLPETMVAKSVETADENFSALHSVVSKQYIYKVYCDELPDPFRQKYFTYVKKPLDMEAMHKALEYLLGEHDFSAFRSTGSNDHVSPIRHIYVAKVEQIGNEYVFTFHANGFLYHMVRNIMGLTLAIGSGLKEPEDMKKVLLSKNRHLAGKMAPANGLYLDKVYYE